jgi:hypothetical protein
LQLNSLLSIDWLSSICVIELSICSFNVPHLTNHYILLVTFPQCCFIRWKLIPSSTHLLLWYILILNLSTKCWLFFLLLSWIRNVHIIWYHLFFLFEFLIRLYSELCVILVKSIQVISFRSDSRKVLIVYFYFLSYHLFLFQPIFNFIFIVFFFLLFHWVLFSLRLSCSFHWLECFPCIATYNWTDTDIVIDGVCCLPTFHTEWIDGVGMRFRTTFMLFHQILE